MLFQKLAACGVRLAECDRRPYPAGSDPNDVHVVDSVAQPHVDEVIGDREVGTNIPPANTVNVAVDASKPEPAEADVEPDPTLNMAMPAAGEETDPTNKLLGSSGRETQELKKKRSIFSTFNS